MLLCKFSLYTFQYAMHAKCMAWQLAWSGSESNIMHFSFHEIIFPSNHIILHIYLYYVFLFLVFCVLILYHEHKLYTLNNKKNWSKNRTLGNYPYFKWTPSQLWQFPTIHKGTLEIFIWSIRRQISSFVLEFVCV